MFKNKKSLDKSRLFFAFMPNINPYPTFVRLISASNLKASFK